MIKVGDNPPDFAVRDQHGEVVTLSQVKGNVLLSFHPLAWTKVCAEQMQSLEENETEFEALKTTPFGVSVDTVPSKKAWAEHLNIQKTRLLSDFWPHGEVARKYGIFREKEGFSERANVIIHDHKVVFVKVYPIPQLPDITEILQVLSQV